MKTKYYVIGIMLMFLAESTVQAGEITLGTMNNAKHYEGGRYNNESLSGFYVRVNGYAWGGYRNSHDKPSHFIGYSKPYKRGRNWSVSPFLMLANNYPEHHNDGILYAVGVQFKWHFLYTAFTPAVAFTGLEFTRNY